jgi:hypothetical protein
MDREFHSKSKHSTPGHFVNAGLTMLMMLLSALSRSVLAGWVEISRNEAVTVYAEPATIRKTGNRAKIWVLYDYQSVQSSSGSKPYRSSRRQSEYDCKEGQSRILSLTGHSANMAEGNTVFSLSKPETWEPVPSSSLGELMWKIACGKS